jgi:hypothetical protein
MVDHDPWVGDNPYFLLLSSLEPNEGGVMGYLVLDVDKTGWQTEYKDWLERSAEWYLCEKGTERVIMAQIVYRGEHPYYLKRHVGQMKLGTSESRSVIVHGVGKRVPAVYETIETKDVDARGEERVKRRKKLVRPERTERLWLLPNNVVCGGEDVEKMAMAIVSAMQWQAPPPEPEIIEGEAVEILPAQSLPPDVPSPVSDQ